LNKDGDQRIWTSEVNVADWDSQRLAFEKCLGVFNGRLDYVFPIAGIGERRSFPNRPNSSGFEKPDLSVIEVDEIGVIYTAWLGVQHFRRQKKNPYGWKGKSMCMESMGNTPFAILTKAISSASSIHLRLLHSHANTSVYCSQTVSISTATLNHCEMLI
jgi:hypothetical protein